MINHKVSGLKIRRSGSSYKVRNNSASINTSVIDNHINSTILNKINGKDPTTSKKIFTSQNPWTPSFIRNPDCWLNGVTNISCMSTAQLSGAAWNQRAGTLISPRHFILAKHFIFAILNGGTDMRFVDDNNNVVTRTAKNIIVDSIGTDIAVGILDRDVPSNIKFAKVLPRNHRIYFTQSDIHRYAIYTDQEEKALLGVNTYIPTYNGTNNNPIYIQNPGASYINEPLIAPFYETPIAGDSGDPMFLLIDNELVIISCWWSPVSGPAYSAYYDIINDLMNKIGGGYNLTPIDLDAVYNKYNV